MKVLRQVFILLMALQVSVAFAAETRKPNDLYIKKKQLIEIDAYEKETGVFEVTDIEMYGQGPLYVTLDNLAKSISALKVDKVKRDPSSIVKQQYMLDEDLILMDLSEYESLKKPAKPKDAVKPPHSAAKPKKGTKK